MAELLLLGCNKSSDDESDGKTKSVAVDSSKQTTVDLSTQMALKTKKGNLWLNIFKSNFSEAESALRVNIIYFSDFSRTPAEVESYLEGHSDQNGQINLRKIRKSKGEVDKLFIIELRGSDPKAIAPVLLFKLKLSYVTYKRKIWINELRV